MFKPTGCYAITVGEKPRNSLQCFTGFVFMASNQRRNSKYCVGSLYDSAEISSTESNLDLVIRLLYFSITNDLRTEVAVNDSIMYYTCFCTIQTFIWLWVLMNVCIRIYSIYFARQMQNFVILIKEYENVVNRAASLEMCRTFHSAQ